MQKVFIDTSAFIALWVPTERYHKRVVKAYAEARKNLATFFTSDYILDELYTRILYDFGSGKVKAFHTLIQQAIKAGDLTMLKVDETIFDDSLNTFIKFSEHKLSFTDATAFVMYGKYNFDSILTLDKGFGKIGALISP